MSVIKCAECGDSSDAVVAYCVECKKVLCRRCVGRLHVPECAKANKHSIERIDLRHQEVQGITNKILNLGICVWLCWAMYRFPMDRNFFKMENICPVVGQGRWWLSSFDVNVFYYFKTSISLYCDVEDSFWRLLMDGWIRGVVTSSDSLLILLSTLPKALLFKVAGVTLLMPILACIYAGIAFLLTKVIQCFEDVLHDIYERVSDTLEVHHASQWKIFLHIKFTLNLPSRIGGLVLKYMGEGRSKTIEKLRMIAFAFGLAGCLRLVVRFFGMRHMPLLWARLAPTANPWQLMFEPVLFFYVARCLRWLDLKISKLFPKKLAAVPEPLTLKRDRPMEDSMESFNYHWMRITRKFNFYKKQAEEVLRSIVDDVFNGAVVVRLVCIGLPVLATIFRTALTMIGLGGMLERHADMFYEATGFRQGEDSMYMSDRLLSLSYWLGIRQLGVVGTLQELTSLSMVWEGVWRILVPLAMYVIYSKWQSKLKAQKKEFAIQWEGARWKTGNYERCLQEYGTCWNVVDVSFWEPVPPKGKAPYRLFSKERAKERRASKDITNLSLNGLHFDDGWGSRQTSTTSAGAASRQTSGSDVY